LLASTSLCAFASDIFNENTVGNYKRGDFVNGMVTAGKHPIYSGENQWKIESMTTSEGGASGSATPITSGTVIFNHFEPNGDWFASMKVNVNLNSGSTNQYFTGNPCSGIHLFVVNKGQGKNDNCLTADVGSFTQGNKSTTYFDVNIFESKSGGRLYVLVIRLNAELLGFRETSVADWSRLPLEDSQYRSKFVARLQVWAEKLQDASNKALDYTPPLDAFNGIESWRSLLPVPTDIELGVYSQQFIGAVESTRNKPKFHSIAYSKVGLGKVRWGNSYTKSSQDLSDKEALETCEKDRPSTAEPCKLYPLDINANYSKAIIPDATLQSKASTITSDSNSIEHRLLELKSLLEKGLISNDAFEKKRNQILNSL